MTQLDSILQIFETSPKESSFAKGIPMMYVDDVQRQYPGKFRYKYRGPSNAEYTRPQSYIVKHYATSFALYLK